MKKGIGLVMIVLGGCALVYGVIMLFNGNVIEPTTWIATILGGIFFSSGLGLLKSTGGGTNQNV